MLRKVQYLYKCSESNVDIQILMCQHKKRNNTFLLQDCINQQRSESVNWSFWKIYQLICKLHFTSRFTPCCIHTYSQVCKCLLILGYVWGFIQLEETDFLIKNPTTVKYADHYFHVAKHKFCTYACPTFCITTAVQYFDSNQIKVLHIAPSRNCFENESA